MANKVVEDKYITIVYHFDNLQLSYIDAAVITEYIDELSETYNKEAPLTINNGKKHNYIVRILDYKTKSKVKIDMSKYPTSILSALP